MLTLFAVIASFLSRARGLWHKSGADWITILPGTRNTVRDVLENPYSGLTVALLSSPGSLLQPGQRDHPRGSA
jgi:hypothetical protein